MCVEAERYLRSRKIACPPDLLALVLVAHSPAILTDRERYGREIEAFAKCYAERPDDTLTILAFVREQLRTWEASRGTQAGRVRDFLLKHNGLVVRKEGRAKTRFELPEALTAKDFSAPFVLKKSAHVKRVHDLRDDEIAKFLTRNGFEVTIESVKNARQELARKGKP